MAEIRFPLSIFDFFAYFLQGFILIIGVLYLFDVEIRAILLTENYLIVLLLFVSSYVLGHIISEISRHVIERNIVKKFLGYPSDFVFNEEHRRLFLFKNYLRPYSKEFIDEFKAAFNKQYNEKFSEIDDYNSFLLCFHTVKENCPNAFSRLGIFISMYDFSRNLSMLSIIFTLLFAIKTVLEWNIYWLLGLILSSLLAVLFLLRYLKFFKSYANEVYYSFYNYVSKK